MFQWTKYFSRSKAYAWFTGWIYLFAGVLTTGGVVATLPLVLIPMLDRLGIGIHLADSLATQRGWVHGPALGVTLHGLLEDPDLVAAMIGVAPSRTLEAVLDELTDAVMAGLDVGRIDALAAGAPA